MKKKYLYRLILYSILTGLLLPLIIIVFWTFAKSWTWPNILPTEWGIRGYKYFMDPSTKSLKILFDSIIISSIVMFLTLMVSIPAGKAIGLYDFKYKKFIKLLILAPIIVPPITVAMGIHVAFIKLGLANKVSGVVLIHMLTGIPYGVRILTNYFEVMGDTLEEQAKILGAKPMQILRYITIPMIAPALVSAGSLIFIISFSQYFLTFLIGGGNVVTITMVMFPFIQSGDRTLASVYSVVFILSTLIVLILVERIVKKFYKTENFFNI